MFDKHGGEAFSRAAGKVYDDGDRDALARLKAEGQRTFLEESAADQAKSRAQMQPLYDQWIGAGPEGRSKFETLQKVLADIRAGR